MPATRRAAKSLLNSMLSMAEPERMLTRFPVESTRRHTRHIPLKSWPAKRIVVRMVSPAKKSAFFKTMRKIAFQGAMGSNSDLACRAMFPDMETVPCYGFEDTFRAVKDGRADLAMIPVDNTRAGRVADVHHLIPRGGLFIVAEHFEPIRMALMGVKGAKLEDIRHVSSHIHALPQCRKIIRE